MIAIQTTDPIAGNEKVNFTKINKSKVDGTYILFENSNLFIIFRLFNENVSASRVLIAACIIQK